MPHITLKSIANNAEIDVIWDKWQAKLEPLREQLNAALKKTLAGVGDSARGRRQVAGRGEEAARRLVAGAHRPAEGDRRLDRRQGRVRIPLRQALRGQEEGPRRRAVHRREPLAAPRAGRGRERRTDRSAARRPAPSTATKQTFAQMILENLKTAGVQQAHKEDRITFTALTPWPGDLVCAEGRYLEGDKPRSAPPSSSARSSAPSARRPGRGRPRGRRRRLRRADRLRLQLRGAHHRVQQARPHPGAQGAHERRPAHGRRPEEHRQGQPLRHLRRAGHRHPAGARTARCR